MPRPRKNSAPRKETSARTAKASLHIPEDVRNSIQPTQASQRRIGFLNISAEIRNLIYDFAIECKPLTLETYLDDYDGRGDYKERCSCILTKPVFMYVCKQTRYETAPLYHSRHNHLNFHPVTQEEARGSLVRKQYMFQNCNDLTRASFGLEQFIRMPHFYFDRLEYITMPYFPPEDAHNSWAQRLSERFHRPHVRLRLLAQSDCDAHKIHDLDTVPTWLCAPNGPLDLISHCRFAREVDLETRYGCSAASCPKRRVFSALERGNVMNTRTDEDDEPTVQTDEDNESTAQPPPAHPSMGWLWQLDDQGIFANMSFHFGVHMFAELAERERDQELERDQRRKRKDRKYARHRDWRRKCRELAVQWVKNTLAGELHRMYQVELGYTWSLIHEDSVAECENAVEARYLDRSTPRARIEFSLDKSVLRETDEEELDPLEDESKWPFWFAKGPATWFFR